MVGISGIASMLPMIIELKYLVEDIQLGHGSNELDNFSA